MRSRVPALFTLDDQGRMLRVNEPGGITAPRFFLGRTLEGNEWRFRNDLAPELTERLDSICRQEPVSDPVTQAPAMLEEFLELLSSDGSVSRGSMGPAYRFPHSLPAAPAAVRVTYRNADLLAAEFADWLGDVPTRQPFFALVADGRVVSLCASVRITPTVHEAGVETHPASRGRGYGQQVVAAWAAAVRAEDAIPVYSTSWENNASRALARKLGLLQYGVDFHIT